MSVTLALSSGISVGIQTGSIGDAIATATTFLAGLSAFRWHKR